MFKLLAVSVLVVTGAAEQFDAKAMFYDPGGIQQVSNAVPSIAGLRPIVFARPFPAHGYVGIHYWFEDGRGTRFSEYRAASEPATFTLNVRTNVDGFFSAWAVESESDPGMELTPMQGAHHGQHLAAGAEFMVLRDVRFAEGPSPKRLFLVFSRAQQEQVVGAWGAWSKLQAISARRTPNGGELLKEVDDVTPGQIGTYVVNQVGNPVAVEIVLRSR